MLYPSVPRLAYITPPAVEVVSLADAKAHLRVTHAAEDAQITQWIKAARAYAEHLTQRSIGSQTLELALDTFPSGRTPLPLLAPPVATLVSIAYRDEDGAPQTLALGAVRLVQSEGAASIVPAADWPNTDSIDGEVRIRYTAGYTPTTVPEEVRAFILLEVGTLYANRETAGEKPLSEHRFAERLLDRSKVWDI